MVLDYGTYETIGGKVLKITSLTAKQGFVDMIQGDHINQSTGVVTRWMENPNTWCFGWQEIAEINI